MPRYLQREATFLADGPPAQLVLKPKEVCSLKRRRLYILIYLIRAQKLDVQTVFLKSILA